jgi:hypothetical protein
MVGVVWIHVVAARLAWGAVSEPKKEIQSLGDSERLDILRMQRQVLEERERLQREEERAQRRREEEAGEAAHVGAEAATAAETTVLAGRGEEEDEGGEDQPLLLADHAERGAASGEVQGQKTSSAGPAPLSSAASSAEGSPRAGRQVGGGGGVGRRRLPGEVEEDGGEDEGRPLLEPDPERGEAGGGPKV